jgi:putative oxidoreductase
MTLFKRLIALYTAAARGCSPRSPPAADLLLRLWVANVFFKSRLTKIASMDTTIMLFTYEYQVPLLPPVVAAYLGTAIELVIPVFLALGLGTRLAALVLIAFNIMAVVSYPARSRRRGLNSTRSGA